MGGKSPQSSAPSGYSCSPTAFCGQFQRELTPLPLPPVSDVLPPPAPLDSSLASNCICLPYRCPQPSDPVCRAAWAAPGKSGPLQKAQGRDSAGPHLRASVDIAGGGRPQLRPPHHPLSPSLHFLLPKAIKILQSTSSLPVPQGEALLLRCAADSNPPAELSWFRGPPAPNATPISSTEILELPRVGTAEEEEFTCQIQHPLGSRNVSLRLSMVGECGSLWGGIPGCWGRGEAPMTFLLCPQRLSPPAPGRTRGCTAPAPSLNWPLWVCWGKITVTATSGSVGPGPAAPGASAGGSAQASDSYARPRMPTGPSATVLLLQVRSLQGEKPGPL